MCVGGGLVNATDLKSVVLSGQGKFDSCSTQIRRVARADKGAWLKTRCARRFAGANPAPVKTMEEDGMRKVDVRELDGAFNPRAEVIGGSEFSAPYVKITTSRYGELFWDDGLKSLIRDLQALDKEVDALVEQHRIDHPEYYEEDEDDEEWSE